MKASELDKKFDEGQDISQFLDLSQAKRHGQEQKFWSSTDPHQSPIGIKPWPLFLRELFADVLPAVLFLPAHHH